MSNVMKHRRVVSLALPALLLTACVEYTIDTTVNADGSGVRVELLEAAPNDDVNIPAGSFPEVMHTTPREGWSHTEEVDSDGDSIHAFRRRTEIGDLPAWSGLTGGVQISGAPPARAGNRVGYVGYGEVRFHNALRLQRAADSDGMISFTYRETFSWDRAADALVEFLMKDLDERLAAGFPEVPALDRGEIIGFARARVWTAVDEGLLSGDADEDALLWAVVRATADQFFKKYPDQREQPVLDVIARSLVGNDEQLGSFLEEEFPGLNIALNSEIVFRLNMPGTVTNSNAHKRDGSTLVWEFGPGDAFHTPVEVFAESVVGG